MHVIDYIRDAQLGHRLTRSGHGTGVGKFELRHVGDFNETQQVSIKAFGQRGCVLSRAKDDGELVGGDPRFGNLVLAR